MFEDVIAQGTGLTVPLVTTDIPEPGTYFLKVTAQNERGIVTNGFDYYSVKGYGKVYGCYCFKIREDGKIRQYEPTE